MINFRYTRARRPEEVKCLLFWFKRILGLHQVTSRTLKAERFFFFYFFKEEFGVIGLIFVWNPAKVVELTLHILQALAIIAHA